ncbi:MAG: hypothetical protein U0166_14000 [Acidobacteriota bacterium]
MTTANKITSIASWVLTTATCIYVAIAAERFARATSWIASLYEGLGQPHLQIAGRLQLWLGPSAVLAAAALFMAALVCKDVKLRDLRESLYAGAAAALLAIVMTGIEEEVLRGIMRDLVASL